MIRELRPGDRLHVLGVAGTAMASLAGLLTRLGYRVSGSDQGAYPPMSTVLEREGIEVRTPFGPGNLPGDCRAVVVGNAIS
ncbi:MAG: Mur ligase domain-containing protein, partial [Acidobacteriota bacterium]|nr:Mur ligase domain-containing protein [Acidobacteriota bacterium]